jgi:hypothetical protein
MSVLDVADKLGSILGGIAALISLILFIRREKRASTTTQPSITRLRLVVLAAAGCAVLGLLALAVFSDPDFALIAIYLTLAFILGGLLGQTVREWVYAPEIEDTTTRRLRFVDRASMFAWISLLPTTLHSFGRQQLIDGAIAFDAEQVRPGRRTNNIVRHRPSPTLGQLHHARGDRVCRHPACSGGSRS